MANFAKIGLNNEVLSVISVNNEVLKDSNGIEQESIGVDFLIKLTGHSTWKQTSFNTQGGVHILGGIPFRKNFAAIGDIYDENRNAFIKNKPFNSWILNEDTCMWEAPIPYPDNNNRYIWNEETLNWTLQNL